MTSVGFDRSARTLVTGSADGTVRLWAALPTGTLKTIYRNPQPAEALWAGGKVLAVAGRTARILTSSGRLIATSTMPQPITAAAAHDGTVALADRRGDLSLLGPRGGSFNGRHVSAVAFEPAGALLLGTTLGRVDTWYLHSRTLEAKTVDVGGPVLGLSAGGSRFLVRLADELRVYTDDGTLVSTIHAAAQHAVLSPGGLGVATTDGDTAQLWDATTGHLRHTLTGHTSEITDAEFSPNGLDLVTVSYDHTGLIYSARSGRLIHRLIGHFFPVYSGSYSPDGHWIVTASQFTAGLWNAGTGQLMFYVGRHAAPLTGASFSPSGDSILTASKDGTARVYHCAICEPLPRLERLAELRLRRLG